MERKLYLVALTESAEEIVEANWVFYGASHSGLKALAISVNSATGFAGCLATLGHHPDSDIRLPNNTTAGKFLDHHCSLNEAASGELILQDLSGGQTQIDLVGVSPQTQA